jgi:hypothetical protein
MTVLHVTVIHILCFISVLCTVGCLWEIWLKLILWCEGIAINYDFHFVSASIILFKMLITQISRHTCYVLKILTLSLNFEVITNWLEYYNQCIIICTKYNSDNRRQKKEMKEACITYSREKKCMHSLVWKLEVWNHSKRRRREDNIKKDL